MPRAVTARTGLRQILRGWLGAGGTTVEQTEAVSRADAVSRAAAVSRADAVSQALEPDDAEDLTTAAERSPTRIIAPLDVHAELQSYLSGLGGHEREIVSAVLQKIEVGQSIWSFVGRERERRAIATWLRRRDHGMLIVTGEPGSGKSALLGNVLCCSDPELRALLARTRQLPQLAAADHPPDHEFVAALHLGGLTVSATVAHLAAATGVGEPLRHVEPVREVEWLMDRLRERRPTVTLLVDALDEAKQPLAIANSVLRGIADLPHSRVVVGTRETTSHGPGQTAMADENLLDALGQDQNVVVIKVNHDPVAVAGYVRQSLGTARDAGLLTADDAAIAHAAELVGKRSAGFLAARLAVLEILACQYWLDPEHHGDMDTALCQGGHALFSSAMERIMAGSPAARPLLEALALSHGR